MDNMSQWSASEASEDGTSEASDSEYSESSISSDDHTDETSSYDSASEASTTEEVFIDDNDSIWSASSTKQSTKHLPNPFRWYKRSELIRLGKLKDIVKKDKKKVDVVEKVIEHVEKVENVQQVEKNIKDVLEKTAKELKYQLRTCAKLKELRELVKESERFGPHLQIPALMILISKRGISKSEIYRSLETIGELLKNGDYLLINDDPILGSFKTMDDVQTTGKNIYILGDIGYHLDQLSKSMKVDELSDTLFNVLPTVSIAVVWIKQHYLNPNVDLHEKCVFVYKNGQLPERELVQRLDIIHTCVCDDYDRALYMLRINPSNITDEMKIQLGRCAYFNDQFIDCIRWLSTFRRDPVLNEMYKTSIEKSRNKLIDFYNQYSQFYDSCSIDHLCEQLDMSRNDVITTTSRLIYNKQLRASIAGNFIIFYKERTLDKTLLTLTRSIKHLDTDLRHALSIN